jgi:O-antigen ligase
MEDPNELSMAVGAIMPLAFAFFDRRRSALRLALLVATVALAGTCAVFTQSRGGQLVFLAVLGVYFVKRLGWRGVMVGLLCALPILLLGGRDTEEAAASTVERLESWSMGMQMLRSKPLVGVGLDQYLEHYWATAHNSYVLTAAELGFPGMVLWSAILYVSVKIPLQVLRGGGSLQRPLVAPVALSWALAMLAGLAGLAAGMLFLSYAYKDLLWIYLGLSGALYQAVRRHQPSFRVEFGGKDLALVASAATVFVVAITVYTRLKLGS